MLLALDPATFCGFACENGKTGTWHLKKGGKHPLVRMEHLLERAIAEWGVTAIAAEDAAAGSWKQSSKQTGKWKGGNAKTAAFHNQLLGVIKLVCGRRTLPLLVLHPATIKAFATGKAFANKAMMRERLRLMHSDKYDTDQMDDNEIDAIWIRAYALDNPYGPPKKAKKKRNRKPKPKATAIVDQRGLPF